METPYNESLVFDMNEMGKRREPFLFVLDFLLKKPILIPLKKAAKHDIWYSINGDSNFQESTQPKKEILFEKHPVSYEIYKRSYELVLKNLEYGNSFLTNLTFPTEIKTNLTLEEIFMKSEAPFKLLFKDKFAVFSPEIFIRIKGNEISSYPMKGTIDASISDAREKILNNLKETAEHHTIVDLIRNDLSMVSTEVKVKRFRYIDEIKTHEKRLLQVSSEITGILPSDYHLHIGEIICKMLPAGSISGAPKAKTLEVIGEAEIYPRGYYTGVFGIFDGTNVESAVMIRFLEQMKDKMIYKSGGGITVFSNPEDEYREMIDKVYVPIN